MPYPEESWEQIAQVLGFISEEEMLRHLYVEQHFSIKQIERTIGYNSWTVRARLLRMGVEMRPRGGAHSPVKRVLEDVPEKELFNLPVLDLVTTYGVHPSTVSSERRYRNKVKEGAVIVQ